MTLPIHSNLPGVNEAMTRSREAFQQYKKSKPAERFQLMAAIASELEGHAQELVDLAAKETFLDRSRLQTELKRTCLQMLSYGQACAKGLSLDIRIQYADPGCQPPRQDLRKMRVPLGPVVVFGASNFPFAYSTAGGDTACALAAGCTVVVKAHPAHPNTSSRVAELINRAVLKSGWDPGIFIHMHGEGFATGQALVMHPFTSAVAFTGSLEGGRALFDLANQRAVPIPVFAEMGSVNPVFILPGKLEQEMKSLTDMLAASITNSAGQFCTNPGLLIAIENDSLKEFEKGLGIK
ncbi:MAG TPA: aldehyde dehydrogenase family protein, partial [Flavisolibacter sp.]